MSDTQFWQQVQQAFPGRAIDEITYEEVRSVLQDADVRAQRRQRVLDGAVQCYQALTRFELVIKDNAPNHQQRTPLMRFIEGFYSYFSEWVPLDPPHWIGGEE